VNFQLSEFTCKHCGAGADIVKPELLTQLQVLRDLVARPMAVNCGYRCPEHNAAVGGAHNSAHLSGQAADISDVDGSLKAYCTPDLLEQCGLWAESYAATPTWIHLQIRPAVNRIFKP
jgi:hypothetical protein